MKKFRQVSSINLGKNNNKYSDDVVLFVEDCIYGVFDGVTSPIKLPYHELSGGRFVAKSAAKFATLYALDKFNSNLNCKDLLNFLNINLRNQFSCLNLPDGGMATTTALAMESGEYVEFLIIGDSGVRINGVEVIQACKLIDNIYIQARMELFASAIKNRSSSESFLDIEIRIRSMIYNGIKNNPVLLTELVDKILPNIQAESNLSSDIYDLLMGGIVGCQNKFANKNHVLGYAVLNGDEVVGPDFLIFKRKASEIHSLEFFTDGYVCPGSEVTIDSWEEMWMNIEKDDPFKINKYPHIKCSLPDECWDDRSLLILKS